MVVVAGMKPISAALREGSALHDAFAVPLEAVERQHMVERATQRGAQLWSSMESIDGRIVEPWGRRISSTLLRKRKEPLDEIVDAFELIVVELKNLTAKTTVIVRRASFVECEDALTFAGTAHRNRLSTT